MHARFAERIIGTRLSSLQDVNGPDTIGIPSRIYPFASQSLRLNPLCSLCLLVHLRYISSLGYACNNFTTFINTFVVLKQALFFFFFLIYKTSVLLLLFTAFFLFLLFFLNSRGESNRRERFVREYLYLIFFFFFIYITYFFLPPCTTYTKERKKIKSIEN